MGTPTAPRPITGGGPYWYPTTNPTPYYYAYPTYVSDPDSARLRFALELIADGGLTKEAIERVAKAALRREASPARTGVEKR